MKLIEIIVALTLWTLCLPPFAEGALSLAKSAERSINRLENTAAERQRFMWFREHGTAPDSLTLHPGKGLIVLTKQADGTLSIRSEPERENE